MKRMMVRVFILIFVLFIPSAFAKDAELRDFFYTTELSLKKDSSILEELTEFVSESEIESEIKKLSVFAMENKPVSSMTTLHDRLSKDVKTIHKNLHLLGYYNSKVDFDIKVGKNNFVTVFISIDAGNKFDLNFSIKFRDQDEKFNEYYSDILKTKFKDKKASMSEIYGLITEALGLMKDIGFYEPKAKKKKVFIKYKEGVAFLDLEIVCGRKVHFGNTEVFAFSGINQQFIRNRLQWNDGEVFNQSKIDSSIRELKNTQIFSTVEIEPEPLKLKEKSLPIRVRVEEDKKNMLDISLMYKGVQNMNFDKKSQATKGVKSIIAKISWTRLNAFGNGETLIFNAEGTPLRTSEKRVDYAFETILTQPDVFMKNAKMEYGASYCQELTNVFFCKSEGVSFKYCLPLSCYVKANVGLMLEHNYVDSDPVFFENLAHIYKPLSHYYGTLTFPISLILDRTDNLLNPTSGYKLILNGSWMKLRGAEVNNLKFGSIDFSYHYSLDELNKNVLAVHLRQKRLWGGDIDLIPLDKRLYAGGINSVRGYANQLAAEMIMDKKVTTEVTMGGKSLFEFNAEYRRKINDNWGMSTFFDGAKVYDNKSKNFEIDKKRWFFSVGIGMRYYTSIGPIRIDFAFPLHRRKDIDSKMQFMMGLGQSF